MKNMYMYVKVWSAFTTNEIGNAIYLKQHWETIRFQIVFDDEW